MGPYVGNPRPGARNVRVKTTTVRIPLKCLKKAVRTGVFISLGGLQAEPESRGDEELPSTPGRGKGVVSGSASAIERSY